jgi:hypothetical protein
MIKMIITIKCREGMSHEEFVHCCLMSTILPIGDNYIFG